MLSCVDSAVEDLQEYVNVRRAPSLLGSLRMNLCPFYLHQSCQNAIHWLVLRNSAVVYRKMAEANSVGGPGALLLSRT